MKVKLKMIKESGKLRMFPAPSYQEFVDSLQEGDTVEATLIRVKDLRSLAQNDLYWRALSIIEKEYGDVDMGKYRWHDYFKGKYLCYTEPILGEEIDNCKSTAELTKKEFSEYIEKIDVWAMDKMNISVLSAEDRSFLRGIG
jgi:hypothetical protein